MAIAGRELRAYFLTPSGYIIIALFTLMTGFFFSIRVMEAGQVASRALLEERNEFGLLSMISLPVHLVSWSSGRNRRRKNKECRKAGNELKNDPKFII